MNHEVMWSSDVTDGTSGDTIITIITIYLETAASTAGNRVDETNQDLTLHSICGCEMSPEAPQSC